MVVPYQTPEPWTTGMIAAVWGAISGGVVNVLGFALSRILRSCERRKELGRMKERFENQIFDTSSPSALSKVLQDLKDFLLDNPKLLQDPQVKEFYEEWLRDPGLDNGLHSALAQGKADSLRRLRLDAVFMWGLRHSRRR
jgi:hypothetical protein